MPSYIHNRTDWPKFCWDQERIAVQLARVSLAQGRLLGRMEMIGFQLRVEAVLRTLTDDVLKSSEIEGEVLDKSQIRSSVARRLGLDIGGLDVIDRNVQGVVDMMLDATQNYGQRLGRNRLFAWHRSLFPTGQSGMSKIEVGRWRTDRKGSMEVVSGPIGREHVHFEAPPAMRIGVEMDAFLAWFNDRSQADTLLKAAIAHLWFVTIHPFEDGNGRIARAIADMALARAEHSPQRFYSMSAQIRAERKGYYDVLEATQKGDLDITRWLDWFLSCLDRAVARADGVLAAILRKARFWDGQAGLAFNERQRLMLNRILDGFEGKITSSKWATIAKCSQDSASRDIEDLIRRGILVKDAAGGRSTSYSLVEKQCQDPTVNTPFIPDS